MKIAVIICNAILVGFTSLVLVTDGPPRGAAHVALLVLLLAVPILSSVVLSRPSTSAAVRIAAALCNVVLLGFAFWAFVDAYPHPEEEGFVAFAIVVLLTPVFSIAALLWGGKAAAGRTP